MTQFDTKHPSLDLGSSTLLKERIMRSFKKLCRVIDVFKNLLVNRLDIKAETFVEQTQLDYIQVRLKYYPRGKDGATMEKKNLKSSLEDNRVKKSRQ